MPIWQRVLSSSDTGIVAGFIIVLFVVWMLLLLCIGMTMIQIILEAESIGHKTGLSYSNALRLILSPPVGFEASNELRSILCPPIRSILCSPVGFEASNALRLMSPPYVFSNPGRPARTTTGATGLGCSSHCCWVGFSSSSSLDTSSLLLLE